MRFLLLVWLAVLSVGAEGLHELEIGTVVGRMEVRYGSSQG
ncbi:MAG: hypothetical protein ACI8T1_002045 [Verrucomicrobiales bacterium]|jgi:hypothetical protein